MDAQRLKESWNLVAGYGDQVPLFFYSTLFLNHPETRDMFPIGMASQRDKLVGALGTIVSNVDGGGALAPFLAQLGRDHRKFAVKPEHYPAVGGALLATLAHFLGPQWTDELAKDWGEAYSLVAEVMTTAADKAAATCPPWWDAEVVAHERRTVDVAVLVIQPRYRLDYLPGQSMAVECHLHPRLWRYYSPANAPRPDGRIELHVKRLRGGPVSSALVHDVQVGDVLKLGAPVGQRLTLPTSGDADQRPLLLLAGGTGLAPLKALVEQVAHNNRQGEAAEYCPRRVTLFIGARTTAGLYDLPALDRFSADHRWLTVVPAISDDPLHPREQGTAVDVAQRFGHWPDHEVYLCGTDDMVRGSVECLTRAGTPLQRIHFESFQGLGGEQYGPGDIAPPTDMNEGDSI